MFLTSHVQRKFGKELKLSYGNHYAFTDSGGTINSNSTGTILHLPVRSRDQIITKVILAVIAKKGLQATPKGRSPHLYIMLKRIAEGDLSDDDLKEFALTYDEKVIEKNADITDYLQEKEYGLTSLSDLNIAKTDSLKFQIEETGFTFIRQIANALKGLESDIPIYQNLKIDGNVINLCKTEDVNIKQRVIFVIRKIKNRIKRVLTKA